MDYYFYLSFYGELRGGYTDECSTTNGVEVDGWIHRWMNEWMNEPCRKDKTLLPDCLARIVASLCCVDHDSRRHRPSSVAQSSGSVLPQWPLHPTLPLAIYGTRIRAVFAKFEPCACGSPAAVWFRDVAWGPILTLDWKRFCWILGLDHAILGFSVLRCGLQLCG